MISIYQDSLSFKKDIKLIDKYDGKTQRRNIYEVIHNNFFENSDYFTSDLLNCVNRMQIFNGFSYKRQRTLGKKSLEGGLY